MKMQELNNTELQEVNGGSILGSANSSSYEGGFLGQLGIGNLLSYNNTTTNGSSCGCGGQQSSSTSLSVGNGIFGSLGGFFGGSSNSIL